MPGLLAPEKLSYQPSYWISETPLWLEILEIFVVSLTFQILQNGVQRFLKFAPVLKYDTSN